MAAILKNRYDVKDIMQKRCRNNFCYKTCANTNIVITSHAGTVVPECQSVLRTTTQVNGKVGNSTPAPSETPEPIVTKTCMDDCVGDSYPYAKFNHDTITWSYYWNLLPYRKSGTAKLNLRSNFTPEVVLWLFLRMRTKSEQNGSKPGRNSGYVRNRAGGT